MKTRINNPIHNPFHNRFHVPVHSRLDEMQAYTHMVWLHSPARIGPADKNRPAPATLRWRTCRRVCAGAGRCVFRGSAS